MGIALRRREFCMVVGILTMLFCSGRSQVIIAAPCNNGTIRGCHPEDELLVDTTEISIYEAVEFVMDSEISRRILKTIPYKPINGGGTAIAKPPRGKPYTRGCTYAQHCRG